ncbi:extracellular solute-binding protein [Paenibacillus piri]|uniref:Extracellular solute-binding protein n=1 Tax=Paenibacillus piri TaxID=2547395 RepID=A0A4R5K8L0_9BACL|nr:extracellular solute-binding protein [Paenibacillus piri]TDF91142.1 extracellular solute-binding protein [Paenibacillus piri]
MGISYKKDRTFIAAGLTVVMTAGVLAACTSTTNQGTPAGKNGTENKTEANSGAPLEFSMMATLWVADPPKIDGEPMKIIQKATNTKLNINWVPSGTYNEKVNATIATGQLPDVMTVTQGYDKTPGFINSVRSGMFWEVGPYLKDYKNLSKYNKNVLTNVSVDGKIYGLPRALPLPRAKTFMYRKDWLDKLGLQKPKSLDDIYTVLKAFRDKDPDGNGKNDTLPIVEGQGIDLFYVALAAYGGPDLWEVRNGQLVPDFMTDENMQALKFMKKLYDEKLMNQDFATLQGNQKNETFYKGTAAAYGGIVSESANLKANTAKIPGADIDFVTRVSSTKGDRIFSNVGYDAMFVFPKSSVKTEEKLKKILDYFDKLADPEVLQLMSWGLEGVHFKMENGKPVTTDSAKFEIEINPLRALRATWDTIFRSNVEGLSEIRQKMTQSYLDNEPYVVSNPAYSLISETYVTKGAELDKMIKDARIKFIMGAIDENGWNSAVDQWKKTGGDKVIAELNAQHAKLKP